MDEDFERAIALSILEAANAEQLARDDAYARSLANDTHYDHENEDYALALQLQESEQKDSVDKGRHRPESQAQLQDSSHIDHMCCVCGNSNKFRSKITALGRAWCPECFKCRGCSVRLEKFYQRAESSSTNDVYCSTCIRELFSIRCTLCSACLEGHYLRHSFFEDEKYCLTHEQIEARKKCFTCSRLEPVGVAFVELPDSRVSCLECLSSAVMSSDEAAQLYSQAVDFLESDLHLKIPPELRTVPVLVVDVHSLNEQAAQGRTSHHGSSIDYRRGGVGSVTRGLTLSRAFSVEHFGLGDMVFSFERGFQMGPRSLKRVDIHREVTAILILYGLPRDLSSSILAHEAMHAWLRLQKDFALDVEMMAEEGMCQFVSHRYVSYLDKQKGQSSAAQDISHENVSRAYKPFFNPSRAIPVRTGGFQTDSRWQKDTVKGTGRAIQDTASPVSGKSIDPNAILESKLRKYFKHTIETDSSPVYGDGYRAAASAVSKLGLDITLEHIRNFKTLPHV
jgi:hypothetical protein